MEFHDIEFGLGRKNWEEKTNEISSEYTTF